LAKIISLQGSHVGRTWFVVYSERHIGTLLPIKVPKQKNLPNTEKMSDQWLSSIKLYCSKKMGNFVFNYNKNCKLSDDANPLISYF
jgi:hypothetical protein